MYEQTDNKVTHLRNTRRLLAVYIMETQEQVNMFVVSEHVRL